MSKAQFDSLQDHHKLGRKTLLSYATLGFTNLLLLEMVNQFVVFFYNTELKIEATTIAWALMIPRIWDAVSDPLMGNISDNTRSRWGRRRPYILVGGILLSLSLLLIWLPSPGMSETSAFVYLVITTTLFFTFWTVTFIPAGALGAELSIDYHQRTRIYAYYGFFSRVGASIAGFALMITGYFASARSGFLAMSAVIAAIAICCFVMVFRTTREAIEPQSQQKISFFRGLFETGRSGPFWLLAGIVLMVGIGVGVGFPSALYINTYYVYGGDAAASGTVWGVFGTVGTVLVLVCIYPMTWLSRRLGKERAFVAGVAVVLLAPLISWFAYTPNYPWLQLIFLIPLAPACAALMIFPGAMIADLVDIDELKTNRRREGSYSSMLGFLNKMFLPVSAMIFAQLQVHFAHFDAKAAMQTDDTIYRLRLILLIAPLIPFVIALILALLYPIREKHVLEVRRLLDERRRAQAAVTSEAT